MASAQQTSTKPTMQNKNVANGQLAFFSRGTGFYKDGYCRTGPDDKENTSIAVDVTEDFLNNQGSYLKSQGVKAGSKACLSTKLWKTAFDAAQKGDLSKGAVPKVYLHASHENALKDLSLKELRQYEAHREVAGIKGAHEDPKSGGGVSSQSNNLGGDMGSTAPSPGDQHDKKTDVSGKRGEGTRG